MAVLDANYYMTETPDSDGVFATEGLASPLTTQPEQKQPEFSAANFAKYMNGPVPINGKDHSMDPSDRMNYGEFFDGYSRLDSRISELDRLETGEYTANQLRGEYQSGANQILSGIAKGAVLAGTTFASGTLGALTGGFNAATEGSLEGFWNDPFSQFLKNVNEWSETAMPNYYSKSEEENPWYRNIFTANFIGDKFLKNLGFSVGAVYSGKTWASAASAAMRLNTARSAFRGATANMARGADLTVATSIDGVVTQLAQDATLLNKGSHVLKGVGALTSALGEAKIEAVNNTSDWLQANELAINSFNDDIYQDEYNKLLSSHPELFELRNGPQGPQYIPSTQAEEAIQTAVGDRFNKNEALAKINEDAAKVGNIDFLLNVALLGASDLWQFGKVYAGGFNTAKKAENLVRKSATGAYESIKPSAIKTAARIVGRGIAEGPFEEMGQGTAAAFAGNLYNNKLNSFYGVQINPDAEVEAVSWIKQLGQSIAQTYGNVDNWEEGFIGSLTGIMGIPGFRRTKSSTGKFQSPIYLQGGTTEILQEHREQKERVAKITDEINARIQSPEFLNYYRGAIRHGFFQGAMDEATEKNDNYSFKNAEHGQFINDIIMYDNANKLSDLYNTIDSVGNVSSEEEVQEIRDLTTNPQAGKSVYDGMSNEQVIEHVQKQASDMKSVVDSYRTISDNLKTKFGDVFEGDELAELTWMVSQTRSWESRFGQLYSDIKENLKPYAEFLIDSESQGQNEQDRLKTIESIEQLLNMSPEKLLSAITSQESKTSLSKVLGNMTLRVLQDSAEAKEIEASLNKMRKGPKKNNYISRLQTLKDSVRQNAELMSKFPNILQSINDMQDISLARTDFINRYVGFASNPESLRTYLANQNQVVSEAEEQVGLNNLETSLKNAQSTKEFDTVLAQESDTSKKDKIIDKLIEEGNPIARAYRDEFNYVRDINNSLDSQVMDEATRQNAKDVFQQILQQFDNLDDFANPLNVEFITPEELGIVIGDDMSIEDFQQGIISLLTAMNAVNNSNTFKDKFSGEYKATPTVLMPNTEPEGGEENVAIKKQHSSPQSKSMPIGDVASEDIFQENEELNEKVIKNITPEESATGKRLYYRPALSYYHGRASQNGDFRTYNIVARESGEAYNPAGLDDIFNYLTNAGAFSFIDNGNLQVGDDVGFMIDPTFNQDIIFIVKLNGENEAPTIIGTISESNSVLSNTEGLQSLVGRIRGEFGKTNKTERFIATPITRVSKLMIGKIAYGKDERSLAKIPGVLGVQEAPILGVIKNGSLNTNGKIAPNNVIEPVNTANKEGRIYLMVKGIDGKYRPTAVRNKRFTQEYFDPTNATQVGVPIYKNIMRAINDMAASNSVQDVRKAMSTLGKELYINDVLAYPFGFDVNDVENNTGIRFTLTRRNSDGTEQQIHQTVYFNDPKSLGQLSDDGFTANLDSQGLDKTTQEVANEITAALMSFELPIQISLGQLNTGKYNEYLINSDVLSSNITEAQFKGNWFITDYFDDSGKLQTAVAPSSIQPVPTRKIENIVGGKEAVISGTQVSNDLTVNKNDRIIDNKGKDVTNLLPVSERETILAEAYVNKNYGDKQNGLNMIDGVVLLPSGKVFDRNRRIFLSGQKRVQFINSIKGNQNPIQDTNKTVIKIQQNQDKIDRTKTTGEFYYILEDDGAYHEYDRVHKRLGDNWIEDAKIAQTLQSIQSNLISKSTSTKQYNEYLRSLENGYKVTLTNFYGKNDASNRDIVYNIVRDKINGTNSQRALEAGTSVDSVIRGYFINKNNVNKPDNMTVEAYKQLMDTLAEIENNIKNAGETFLTSNIVLFHKYADGTRVAGEVDILAVDKNGRFKVYDVKTGRYSFHDFIDSKGRPQNYFLNKNKSQRMSTKDYYTWQLSAYKNLFESQYGEPIVYLGILPFVLEYGEGNEVTKIIKEKGIPITYDSSTPVKLEGSVAPQSTAPSSSQNPIFNPAIESLNPSTQYAEEKDRLPGSTEGYYYDKDGILNKGFLKPLGTIKGQGKQIPIYIVKRANSIDTLSGQPTGDYANDYYAIVGNSGKPFAFINDGGTEANATRLFNSDAQTKVARISELYGMNTQISDAQPVQEKVTIPKVETIATVAQPVAASMDELDALMNSFKPSEEEVAADDNINLGRFRMFTGEPTNTTYDLNNPNEELAWLNRALPQLSENELVNVQKGLIKVANSGSKAWGQFNNGIMTLSDLNNTGTVYHEAFHTVFELMLTTKEQESLFSEAKKRWGDMGSLELEENMAEGFREYMLDRKGFTGKIKTFFDGLIAKIQNWMGLRPSLYSYYYNINKGNYSGKQVQINSLESLKNSLSDLQKSNNLLTFASMEDSMRQNLEAMGWTEQDFNSVSREEQEQAIKCI